MDASIEVLGVSDGDVPSYHEHDTHSTSQRLHCRVVVAQESSARHYFDDITITLHGALLSRIGSKAAVERLLHLGHTIKRSSFEQTSLSKESSASSLQTEVTFDLPEVIPSLSLTGTIQYTRSSALADRHQISGKCNTRYWLEAEFKHKGLPIRSITCPVDFSKLMQPSHMTVLASGRSSCTRQPIRVQRRMLSFGRKTESLPAMTFEVPHQLGVVASTPKDSGASHQRLSIPLTVSIPQCNGSLVRLSEGIENVSVQANWLTTKSFRTSRLPADDYNSASVIRKGTIVRQKAAVSFPPFFEDGKIDQSLYSSTTCLNLVLPDTINDSSIKTDLASVLYELDLEAAFDVKLLNGRFQRCRSSMRIPLEVHMS